MGSAQLSSIKVRSLPMNRMAACYTIIWQVFASYHPATGSSAACGAVESAHTVIEELLMTTQDIRWIQRFNNFNRALSRLKAAVELAQQRPLSPLEEQGLIQAFEFTHELAWNTLKDFLEDRGVQNVYGSKDTSRQAFKAGLIENGEAWMDMIISRNLTSHTYNEAIAARIAAAILETYFAEFEALQNKLEQLQRDQTA